MFTVSRLAVGASTSGFGLLGVWAAEVLLTWDLSWPKWVLTNLAHWRVGWSVWDTKMAMGAQEFGVLDPSLPTLKRL